MMADLRVPVASHDDLGVIVAADLADDDALLEQLRSRDVRAGLRCASCEGPVQFVDATRRIRHFRHTRDAACLWGPESHWHLAMKDAFVRAFSFWRDSGTADGWTIEITPEFPAESRRWQADVACVATRPDGVTRRLMVEIQQSPQSAKETSRRTAVRHADGWDVLWAHYNPEERVAPWWLREAAPAVGLAVNERGVIKVASGYLEHIVATQQDVQPWARSLGPGVEDPVVIDEWDTGGEFLPMFVNRWLAGDGLLTDSIEGRTGLAWVLPPAEAGLDPAQRVLVDTFEAYAWQQKTAEAAVARERAEAAQRHLAAEEQRERMVALLRPLYRLLGIVPPRAAKYAAGCFTCGTRIEVGVAAAMMKNALTRDQWRLICSPCSSLLAMSRLST
jgi:hypothetical protein